MNRLKQLYRLSWQEWCFLLIASLLLPLSALSIRLFGFKRTRKLLDLCPTIKTTTEIQKQHQAQTIARKVIIAANHGLYRANCLQKAFVLCLLLKCIGIKANLHIGVHKTDDDFNAHAWAEFNGTVLLDTEESILRYYTVL